MKNKSASVCTKFKLGMPSGSYMIFGLGEENIVDFSTSSLGFPGEKDFPACHSVEAEALTKVAILVVFFILNFS